MLFHHISIIAIIVAIVFVILSFVSLVEFLSDGLALLNLIIAIVAIVVAVVMWPYTTQGCEMNHEKQELQSVLNNMPNTDDLPASAAELKSKAQRHLDRTEDMVDCSVYPQRVEQLHWYRDQLKTKTDTYIPFPIIVPNSVTQ